MRLVLIILKKVFSKINKLVFVTALAFCCLILRATSNAPPGFEQFLGKQSTIADIYYGGLRVGDSLISYDLERIWIEEAEKVVSLLPDIKPEEVTKILAILKEPMPRNSQNPCLNQSSFECELPRPDSVDIVFDESKFQVDIYVNRALRISPVHKSQHYLKFPAEYFSSLHSMNGSQSEISINDQVERSSSLFINSLFAYKNHRINSSYFLATESKPDFSHFSYLNEGQSSEFEIGYMQNTNHYASLIVPQRFYGISWRNHLKHRLDLSSQSGSEVRVFLDIDSKIEVFRRNELLSVQYLEAGNQLLDTEFYPEGSYFVDIKITDRFGKVRTKRQYFVKSNQLPPLDETLWLFELGVSDARYSVEARRPEEVSFFRAESVRRITDNMGYSLGAIVSDKQRFWYSAWDYYWYNLHIRQEGGLSDGGFWQYSSRLQLEFEDRISLVISDQKNSRDKLGYLGRTFGSSNGQRQVSLSIPFEATFVSYNYQKIVDEFSDEVRQGLNLRHSFGTDGRGAWSLLLDWIKESDSQSINLRMQYNFLDSNTQAVIESGKLISRSHHLREDMNSTRLNVNRRLLNQGPLSWKSGFSVLKQREESLFTLRNTLDLPYFLLDSGAQLGQSTQQELSSNFINFSTNLVTTKSGLYWGGQRGKSSGVVIDFELPKSASADSTFVVLVNNIPVKRVYSTSSVFLPVPSYRKVRLRIRQEKGKMLNTDFREKEMSLLPGQVERVTYKLEQIYVVVGQLFNTNNEALSGVSVGHANSFHQTDEKGWFQVEVSALDKLNFFEDGKKLCSVELSTKDIEGDVIWLDSVNCDD